MSKKVLDNAMDAPISQDDVQQGFSFTPKTDEDKSLFAVLQQLRDKQQQFDEQLSKLPASTLDHGKRYAVRMQGHVTFNKNTKKWTAFNGRYHQEAPRWFLIQGVDIVSKGLAREAQVVTEKSQSGLKTLCTALSVSLDALKGKSRKEKVETLRRELYGQSISQRITPEQFQQLLKKLEEVEGYTTVAGALLLESGKIRDGRNPVQVLEQASCEYGIEHAANDYDSDGLLKVVLNGTLDLRYLDTPEMLLRPSRPEDLNTMCMAVVYDPTATATKVQEQFRWVFLQPGTEKAQEEEILRYARMIFGGTLDTTRTKGTFLILSGIPGSGKSILLNTLGDVLGTYTAHVDGSFFLDNPHRGKGDASPHMAKVVNKALVLSTEVKNASVNQMDEVLIKNWTGGDKLSYRPLYADELTFKPNAQLIMSTNELPKLSGDKAVGDRHRLAVHHCSRTVPASMRRDEDALRQELLAEGAGFLNILLKGLRERNQVEGRIKPPVHMTEYTEQYIQSQDEVENFFQECSIQADPQNGKRGIESEKLYNLYKDFKGDGQDTLSNKMFSMKLQGRGFSKVRANKGYVWKGIFAPEGKQKRATEEGVREPNTTANGHSNGHSNGHKPVSQTDLDLELEQVEGL